MIKETIPLRNMAHLGDAVWDVFVREILVFQISNVKLLHKNTTNRVNATFQKDILNFLEPFLNDEEHELSRRARNLPIPVGRRSIQHDYRMATAFEVLIGYWYLNDKERLNMFLEKIKNSDLFKNV